MKKAQVFGVLFTLIFSVLLLSTLVSARSVATDVNSAVEGFMGFFKPIFEQILGEDTTNSSDLLFARILLLLIIFAIIWMVMSRLPFFADHTWVVVVISVGISILAMRGIISQNLVETILLPSKTLGIALTAGIPFVIYALIVESDQGLGKAPRGARNAAWIFFAVIFLGLWIGRYDSIVEANGDPAALYVYPLTALLAVIMIVMDGTIRKWRNHMAITKAHSVSKNKQIRALQAELVLADSQLASSTMTPAAYQTEVARIRTLIDALV